MSAPPSPNQAEAGPTLEVGDKVGVGKNQEQGTVRFVGVTEFAAGEWIGVELDLGNGKNDGTVKGVQYFSCPDGKGIFVRRANLTKVGARRSQTVAEFLSEGVEGPRVSTSSETSVSLATTDQKKKLKRSSSRRSTSRKRTNTNPPVGSPADVTTSTPATSSSTRPQGPCSQNTLTAQRQLAEAVEERNVDMIRRSLAAAVSVGGVHQKELETARYILSFEDNKNVLQEFQGVAQAVESLNMTLKNAEERAAEVQKRAEESQRSLASNIAGAALKDWLSQVVGLVEKRVWATLEERVETKVRNAVRSATKELSDAALRLQDERSSSMRSALKSKGRAKVKPDLKLPVKPAVPQKWARLAQIANATARRNGIEDERRELGPRKIRRKAAKASRVLPPPIQYGLLDVPGSGPCDVGWQWTGFSWKWKCGAPRWSEQEQIACRNLQKAARRVFARNRGVSKDMRGFGNTVDVVRRRNKAWASVFDEAGKGASLLDLQAFKKALREIHPRLSTAQMRALYDGFLEGAATKGIPLKGFCDIAEACAAGDQDAAEFADIHPSAWQQLGFQDDKDPREEAAVKIQRAALRRRARARITKKARMGSIAVVAMRRHNAWLQIFNTVSQGLPMLDLNSFRTALLQVQPEISRAQVRALFKCYQENTGQNSIDLRGFCDIAEACASGGSLVAEFADMSEPDWEYLATQAYETPEERAACKIQRIVRGNQARARAGKRTPMARVVILASRRNKAWLGIFNTVAKGSQLLDLPTFRKAMVEVAPRLSGAQCRALFNAYTETVRVTGVNMKAFFDISEGVAAGDEADVLDRLDPRDMAAARIQRIIRGNQARAKLGKRSNFGSVVAVARKRNNAWCQIFEEAAKSGDVRTQRPLLDLPRFQKALLQVHPLLPNAQLRALWDGYIENSGNTGVGLKDFCAICKAVAAGDDEASEFADMCVEEYQQLAIAKDSKFLQKGASQKGAQPRSQTSRSDALEREKRREAARQKAQAHLIAAADSGLLKDAVTETKQSRASASAAARQAAVTRQRLSLAEAKEFSERRSRVASALLDNKLSASTRRESVRQKAAERLTTGLTNGSLQDALSEVSKPQKVEEVRRKAEAAPKAAAASPEQVEAAKTIQRVIRGNQARARCGKGAGFGGIVTVVRRRNAAWTDIFNEVRGAAYDIDQDGFAKAMKQVHPKLAAAQVSALFRGFCSGTGLSRMEVRDFGAMCEAVATGPEEAAEFADISPDTFEALGAEGTEAAAVKIQAIERGRRERKSMRAGVKQEP